MSKPTRLSGGSAKPRAQSLTARIQAALKHAGYVAPTISKKDEPILTNRHYPASHIFLKPSSTRPDRNCTPSTLETIDTSYSFFDHNSFASYTTDVKSNDSQRSSSSKAHLKLTNARGAPQPQPNPYQQFLSYESNKPSVRSSSYRDKLKMKSSTQFKPIIKIDSPKHNLNQEFIEPQDNLQRSPNSQHQRAFESFAEDLSDIIADITPSFKYKRHSSSVCGDNDLASGCLGGPSTTDRVRSKLMANEHEVKQRPLTTPATPKSQLSPREQGSKELLAVLRRKYAGIEFEATPIQMPVECPKVVLVCKGNRIQAFEVRAVSRVV